MNQSGKLVQVWIKEGIESPPLFSIFQHIRKHFQSMKTMRALRRKGLACALLLIAMVPSCSNSDEPAPSLEPPLKTLDIDPNTTYQTVSGFGGANQMWGTQFPNASDMQTAFGMEETDLGLSIFRIRVPSNADEWPLIVDVTREAVTHGATIMASPWSPPAALKSNGSDIGGYLPEENYGAFANHLNEFIDFMASNGAPVDVVSIQNEPDIQVTYESCDWSSPDMRNFLKDYGDLIEGAQVAAPESFNFNPFFTNDILNDDAAAANVDIVAGHIYGGGLAQFPIAERQGKEVWMTEYLLNQNATGSWSELSNEVIWDETLQMLGTMHQAMTNNWNAYIWWYLKRYYSFVGDGTQGTTSGEVLKRGYAFSHFSKFVRPGYVRVGTDFQHDAQVTAYQGDGKTVVVMINENTATVSNISLTIGGETPSSATVYETTASSNRTKSTVEATDGNLVLSVAPKTVVTVVVGD